MTAGAAGFVIGCDVGSQSTVAALYSADGDCLATARRRYDVSLPHPNWAEQDPRDWVRAVCETVREVAAMSPGGPTAVAGLGIASQLDGLVMCGRDGAPLRPAIIWMDRRATEQVAELCSSISAAEFTGLVGANADASHAVFKAMWARDRDPAAFAATTHLLAPGAFVLREITGVVAVDPSNASSFAALDPRSLTWCEPVLNAARIDPVLLPPVAAADEVAGCITGSFAAATGLSPSTVVAVGCGDEMAATLGAGVSSPGEVCDIVGTAEPVCTVVDAPVTDASGRLECHPHAEPGKWLLENPGFVSGGNLRWWQDEFRGAGENAARHYDDAVREAGDVPPGARGVTFLPCMQGATVPTWNSRARGVVFGVTLSHGRADVTRAVLEGSAFALRDVLTAMTDLGVCPRRLTVVGGGAEAPLWCQIKADVTGLPVIVPATTEATALGAAVLAAVAAGLHPSPAAAVSAMARQDHREVAPDPGQRAAYDEAYAQYLSVYRALDPVFR